MREKEGKIDIQMFVWSGLERREAMEGIWRQKYVLFLTERGKKTWFNEWFCPVIVEKD